MCAYDAIRASRTASKKRGAGNRETSTKHSGQAPEVSTYLQNKNRCVPSTWVSICTHIHMSGKRVKF